ncbi:MAG: flagellar biosynthesis protein FlgL [Campylobacterales bacterium]|nr:flagellar biosynthesis protein FlgL [Campylobacterales bacterium]
MRITNSMHYREMYGDNNKTAKALFDVNKQIASGLKIQYAHEDNVAFIDTMRLDNEVTTLTQVKKSTQSGYKFSTQTDTVLGDFSKTLDSIKTKLIRAASDEHSSESLDAVAKELRGLQAHLFSLANTSINGQFLFSGSQTSTKPIDANGRYQGNDADLKAFLGHEVEQKYNISGQELFLGEESKTARKISTNIKQLDLNALYPHIMQPNITADNLGEEHYITPQSTIRDLMGDNNATVNTTDAKHFFYVQGAKHDGESFKAKYAMRDDESIASLMEKIANDFGGSEVVNVTLNQHGQIEIEDRLSGSSKLDFHLVGATDFGRNDDDNSGAIDPSEDDANVTHIDALVSGVTDFEDAAANGKLYVKEFIKSGLGNSVGLSLEGLVYDRADFEADGQFLNSNVSQIVKGSNAFATDSTKLSEVFSSLNSSLHVSGSRIDGSAFSIDINLNASPVTVTGDYSYDVLDASGNTTAAADMTYRQLLDVVNMAMNAQDPGVVVGGYEQAIKNANQNSSTTLSYDGRISFEDKTTTQTQAALSIYDANSGNFSAAASMATFQANNALTIRDPKTDFFAQLDEVIRAVEQGKMRADGDDADEPRNVGIQNAIQVIDDLGLHVSRMQTRAGAQSQSLDAAVVRTDMLLLNSNKLRSEVIDTDIAEAALKLQQLQLNYQALFSTVSKISQLSLVKYI